MNTALAVRPASARPGCRTRHLVDPAAPTLRPTAAVTEPVWASGNPV